MCDQYKCANDFDDVETICGQRDGDVEIKWYKKLVGGLVFILLLLLLLEWVEIWLWNLYCIRKTMHGGGVNSYSFNTYFIFVNQSKMVFFFRKITRNSQSFSLCCISMIYCFKTYSIIVSPAFQSSFKKTCKKFMQMIIHKLYENSPLQTLSFPAKPIYFIEQQTSSKSKQKSYNFCSDISTPQHNNTQQLNDLIIMWT